MTHFVAIVIGLAVSSFVTMGTASYFIILVARMGYQIEPRLWMLIWPVSLFYAVYVIVLVMIERRVG